MRLYHTGFEWQSLSEDVEVGFTQGFAVNTSIVHGGAVSARANSSIAPDDVAEVETAPLGNQTAVFCRYYVYIASLPNNADVPFYCGALSGSGVNVINIDATYNGSVVTATVYYNDFGSTAGTFNIPMQQWVRIEFYYDSTPANGSEILQVRVDDTEVVNLSNLNYAQKNINLVNFGIYNGTGSSVSTHDVYLDDIAVNNASGSYNNSWPGDGQIVAAVPSGAGDNNPTAGSYASVNEIPVTSTATSSANRIELDNNGTIADFTITGPATLGITSGDDIKAIMVLARLREESSATTSYQLRIKSASGGAVQTTTASDAGNTTARTNPNGTTSFGRLLISETDPTTSLPWTATGTNSLQNAQIGISSGSSNDIWVTAMAAMIEYASNNGGGEPITPTHAFFPFIEM